MRSHQRMFVNATFDSHSFFDTCQIALFHALARTHAVIMVGIMKLDLEPKSVFLIFCS